MGVMNWPVTAVSLAAGLADALEHACELEQQLGSGLAPALGEKPPYKELKDANLELRKANQALQKEVADARDDLAVARSSLAATETALKQQLQRADELDQHNKHLFNQAEAVRDLNEQLEARLKQAQKAAAKKAAPAKSPPTAWPCATCRHGKASDVAQMGWECGAQKAMSCSPFGQARLYQAREVKP